jgi:hypothetical protein
MTSPPSITTIRTTHCSEFIPHKVLAACTPVPTPAKDPDLVNKIALFQNAIFVNCKYILSRKQFFMKPVLLLLAVPFMMAETCKSKKSAAEGIPTCIQNRIDSISKHPKWSPPAQVNEYRYNGKTVFVFTSDCCDQFETAWDENCNYVCAPSGGITGRGDGSCADFNSSSTHVRLVWKDER